MERSEKSRAREDQKTKDRTSGPKERSRRETSRRGRRRALWLSAAVLGILLVVALLEFRGSVLSARAFATRARQYTYEVRGGPAREPLQAPAGPYDVRLGYTRLREMTTAAEAGGFEIVRQARPSEALREYVAQGLAPPFPEKGTAGLSVTDEAGRVLYTTRHPRWVYESFDRVPAIVWRTLLWVEDRELSLAGPETRNPAIDWDRLARAFLELGLSVVDRDRRVPGGSTLATQIEKFRHSPGGRTSGLRDKWRQIVSASTRAYREGPRTGAARREIILTYLNSVPLSAHPDWGEVTGIGEGIHVWLGADAVEDGERLRAWTAAEAAPTVEQARAYVRVLALILAERRPSYYLRSPDGREALAELVIRHVPALVEAGIVTPELAELVEQVAGSVLGSEAEDADVQPADTTARTHLDIHTPVTEAATSVRGRLLPLLDVESVYDLDRLDLQATATLDSVFQDAAVRLIDDLADPGFVSAAGLAASGLLGDRDPAPVRYSILLMETADGFNRVRVEADNLEGAASFNAAGRLELGSTAKLRTLVTYLETIADIHGRLSALSADSLRALRVSPRDALTGWVVQELRATPRVGRRALLERAMTRTYSASPAQRFATGGGIQTFRNFDASWDGRRTTVAEAFRHSVNLPFVRILRDVVEHRIFAPWSPRSQVLSAPDSIRLPYLRRFVDREATEFVTRFDAVYRGLDRAGIHAALLENRGSRPRAAARALRWVDSTATEQEFRTLVTEGGTRPLPPGFDGSAEFGAAASGTLTLADVAWLSSVHPFELWVARYRLANPDAERSTVVSSALEEASSVYAWLLDPRRRARQDSRIYSILEIDAFEEILESWQRLGYPFRNIVPSIGTAIGSSGDRPAALAELVGIVLNDGMRHPQARVTALEFGTGTPYEVSLRRSLPDARRVLSPEIAGIVRAAMIDVADNGTARRARSAFRDEGGERIVLGGKTGTGDNRSRSGADAQEQVRNRTSTLVFFAGDRWFGVVTVYVPGPRAADYRFTSALASEVLRLFGERAGTLRTSS